MVFKCRMCGGSLAAGEHEGVGTCDSCGSTMTLPKASDERRANLFNRASHLQGIFEFDKAIAAYEVLLNEDDTDAEAHWGVVLCRYGIEYVEDPKTHKRIPTCHRLQYVSVLKDPDYLAALECTVDGYVRSLYEREAAAIAEIQKGILALSNREEAYDVFISYKEQSESGVRTRDSAIAQDLYYQLVQEGYRVFFSRISLEDKLGSAYEPYIFSALNSARVMVVVGTKPEHFNAVWVKNEWSRYLKLAREDRTRVVIPCYRDMDPYDLPEELSLLQSLDMAKIGFMQDLVRGIKKIIEASRKNESTSGQPDEGKISGNEGRTNPLLERAFIFLEDGDFGKAEEYLERVLDQEPKNGRAYWGKFLAKHQCTSVDYLVEHGLDSWFSESSDFRKATAFSDTVQRIEFEECRMKVQDRINREMEAERIRLERIEEERLRREEEEKRRLEALEQERLRTEEAQRILFEQERLREEEAERLNKIEDARRGRIALIIFGTVFLGIILWINVFDNMFDNINLYNKARNAMQAGRSYEAFELYHSLGEYKDAKELSFETYAAFLELDSSAGVRNTGYQWLLDNGYPQEKVFESFTRVLATTGSEEDRLTGWRWLDSKDYGEAKAGLYEIAKKMVEDGRYYEGYELYSSLADFSEAKERSLDAYIGFLELDSSAGVRNTGYQWLLGNGYPQEKVFESFTRVLATTESEEDRIAGWRWLDSKGYGEAKAGLYGIAEKMVEDRRYFEGYELFSELADFEDSREQANALAALTAKITFDPQGGTLSEDHNDKVVAIGGTYGSLPTPIRDGYVFAGWWTGKNGTGKQVTTDSVVRVSENQTLYAKWRDFIVGDIGPCGGYVFYDKGSYSDGWRYLEAAPVGNEYTGKVWGGYGTTVGGTGTALGTGKSNTEKIVAKFGNAEPYEKKADYAAKLCADLVVTKDGVTYDDWFLPSKDELNLMYQNLKKNNLGGFSGGDYWGSSENDDNDAWAQYFYNGSQSKYSARYSGNRVRPVRAY